MGLAANGTRRGEPIASNSRCKIGINQFYDSIPGDTRKKCGQKVRLRLTEQPCIAEARRIARKRSARYIGEIR
jgi:hypothetical protein